MATEDDQPDYSTLEPEDRANHLGTVDVSESARNGAYDGEVPVAEVTDEMIQQDEGSPTSWLQYNGNLAQTGYSPADRITTDNVGDLSEAYTVETDSQGLETDPVVVPGDPPAMYFTQHSGLQAEEQENEIVVWAVNARTGETFWKFTYKYPQGVSHNNEAIGVNRGVTVYEDKVYFGAEDTRLVAVDRKSGEQAWATSILMDEQEQARTSISEAPLAYDGKIFVGQAGDAAGWSSVAAVDAESGEVVWEQPTIKRDGWVGDTWRFGSGAGWMSPAVDAKSDTVFWSIANPDPMMNGLVRPGPNPYTVSVMALDTNTGEIKWNHQILAHELWDYDCHTTPLVFDMKVNGEKRRVVAHDWKAGWIYLIDAETGKLIDRTEPFAEQGGPAFLSPPPAREENAERIKPTAYGATEWPPDAYSPKTGLRYLGANNAPQKIWYDPTWAWGPNNYDASGGGFSFPDSKNNSVDVVAMDPASGKKQWSYKVPDVDPTTAAPLLFTGGTTATGGNLVFHASSGHHLYALDAKSGDELWSADAGGRMTASPVVWDDPKAGKQFVAVASDNEIVAYSAE